MTTNSQIFGSPVKVTIPNVDAILHPLTMEVLAVISENIAAKKILNIPSVSEMIGALESIVFRQGFEIAQAKDLLRVSVAEIAVQVCEMKQTASDVSFDEILSSVATPMGLYDALLLCARDWAGDSISKDTCSALVMYINRKGMGSPECNVNRWLEISGLREPENPTISETAS